MTARRSNALQASQTIVNDNGTLQAGWFRFYFADDRWEWSAEAAELHGYPPVRMSPSTDQVMAHKHPGDHARMAATLENARQSDGVISTRHRIVDVHGATRQVVVVGQHVCDDQGNPVGTHGFYIDATPSSRQIDDIEYEYNRRLNEAVADIEERRSAIDEAKGMLMLVYRLPAETAFEVLRWRSQETNTKLRAFAVQLVDDFRSLDYDETLPTRAVFDDLLLTAHERIAERTGAAERRGNDFGRYR